MTKFRIIHLTTSLKIGGAETVLVDLVRNLDADLYENHVIYFYDGPNVKLLQKLNIKTYKIKGLICKYDPVFIFRLFYTIKKIKPDIIHSLLWSANILGNIVAKLFRIPIASVLHLATNFESSGKNTFFRNMLDKTILPNADAIIAVSDSMIKDLNNHCKWIPSQKLKVIKNGIDIENIKKMISGSDCSRINYGINSETFLIGNVGRFIPRKNQIMLINVFAKLANIYKNIQLVLIGYGPSEDDLRNRAKELSIEDKICFIKSDRAYEFYQIFDCFVLTSDQESFGLVTLEAMLFGLPCIVTSSNSNHEIITDGINGYLVKNGDTKDLYKKLKILYENKDEQQRLGANAKNHVYENFDIKVMVKNYELLFNQLNNHIQK